GPLRSSLLPYTTLFRSPQLDTLGAGSAAFPVTASGLIDDTHYVVSRHMSFSPAVMAGYDQNEDTITYQENVELDGDASNGAWGRSEEHTSELQSRFDLV